MKQNIIIAALLLTAASAQAQVGPLLTTTWNQNTPYNDLCPTDEEVVEIIRANDEKWGIYTPLESTSAPWGYGGHCPTGCIPTAVAQVMNYWKWPKQGSLSHTGDNIEELHADFYLSTYDWDHMLDNYESGIYPNYTEEEGMAVAKLMADIGVAFDTFYVPYETPTGSSWTQGIPLLKYFGYSDDICCYRNLSMLNESNESDDWNFIHKIHKEDIPAILRNELDAGRPVLCTVPARGGHGAVCDGYNSEGLFHFNFGWSGEEDGYYDPSFIIEFATGIHPAEKELIDGVWYEKKGTEAVATHPNGSTDYNSDINIRSTVSIGGTTLPVTGIAKLAFRGKDITGLTLPASIKQIPAFEFKRCNYLSKLSLPNGMESIGKQAFYECKSLRTVEGEWGNRLKQIGDEAFYFCEQLRQIPDFTSPQLNIGTGAFQNCQLDLIRFRGKGTVLSQGAFINNETWVQGWENVAEIGPAAFTKIIDHEFTIQPHTKYAHGAIMGEFDRIVIPASATNYTDPTSVTGTVEYVAAEGHPLFSSRNGWLLSKDHKELMRVPEYEWYHNEYGQNALMERTDVTVPPFITKMSGTALNNHITWLTIPASVKSIGGGLHRNAPRLERVTCLSATPPSLVWDDDVRLHLAVLRVPHGSLSAYQKDSQWAEAFININDDGIAIDGQFVYEPYPTYGIATLIARNTDAAFDGHARIPSTMMYDGQQLTVDDVGLHAFADDLDVTAVTLPKTVQYMSGHSFADCDNLAAINVEAGSETLRSIDGMLFGQRYGQSCLLFCPPMRQQGTTRVERSEVTLPQESEWIATMATARNLKSVVIPATTKQLEGDAFAGSPQLRRVTCLAQQPPYGDYGSNLFCNDTYDQGILCVPAGCVGAYQTANDWRSFLHIYEVGNIPTGIVDIEHSTWNIDHSTWNIEHSSLNIDHSPAVYDIGGRRVAKPSAKGLYIIGGRKVVKQ